MVVHFFFFKFLLFTRTIRQSTLLHFQPPAFTFLPPSHSLFCFRRSGMKVIMDLLTNGKMQDRASTTSPLPPSLSLMDFYQFVLKTPPLAFLPGGLPPFFFSLVHPLPILNFWDGWFLWMKLAGRKLPTSIFFLVFAIYFEICGMRDYFAEH